DWGWCGGRHGGPRGVVPVIPPLANQRQAAYRRNPQYLRHGFQLFDEHAIIVVDLLDIGEAAGARGKLECEDVVRADAEIGMRMVPVTARGQSSAGKQAQRESKLRHHQRLAQAIAAPSGTRAPALCKGVIYALPDK